MELINHLAEEYAGYFSSPEDGLIRKVSDYTMQAHPHAHMLSGHVQGNFLTILSTLLQPQRILEIGTFTGYSALCLAKGLQTSGVLHTIELREDDGATAQNYFRRSIYKQQIILHIGNALEIIGQLEEQWDLVFIDADKLNYINYFNLIFPSVKPNGFILADNVLFHGEVLEAEIKGKNAKAIQSFNDFILKRTDVEKLMLPVRDGLYLLRKLP